MKNDKYINSVEVSSFSVRDANSPKKIFILSPPGNSGELFWVADNHI